MDSASTTPQAHLPARPHVAVDQRLAAGDSILTGTPTSPDRSVTRSK